MQLIRPYAAADKKALLEILRLNTPQYFAAAEEADFHEYLAHRLEAYYVVEVGGRLVGAGGLNYFDDYTWARISWDLVHPHFQGKGIGKALLRYRLEQVSRIPSVRLLQVRTSQLVYLFYQKFGFELERVEKDFWAKGFDLYQLKMDLNHLGPAS